MEGGKGTVGEKQKVRHGNDRQLGGKGYPGPQDFKSQKKVRGPQTVDE